MSTVATTVGLAGRGLDAARDGRHLATSVIAGMCGAPAVLVARARQVGALLDRLGGALDDLSDLVETTRRITAQLDVLSETALTLGDSAGDISRDAVSIVEALDHVERLAVPGHQVGCSRLIGGSPPSALWRRRVL